jgi:hypothetical protein
MDGTMKVYDIVSTNCSAENELALLVYPNPSKDLINIQVSQGFQRIELKSTSGQLLRTSDESSMHINDLKPGPYFLTIYSNGQSLTKRIVKI